MKTYLHCQTGVLALGTLFAWGNFGVELMRWLQKGEALTCSGTAMANPFATACFYGAIFFTVAFILNIGMLRRLPASEDMRKKE